MLVFLLGGPLNFRKEKNVSNVQIKQLQNELSILQQQVIDKSNLLIKHTLNRVKRNVIVCNSCKKGSWLRNWSFLENWWFDPPRGLTRVPNGISTKRSIAISSALSAVCGIISASTRKRCGLLILSIRVGSLCMKFFQKYGRNVAVTK